MKWRPNNRRRARLLVLGAILVLVAPTVASSVVYDSAAPTGQVTRADDVVFVGVQGQFAAAGTGRVVAVERDSRRLLWSYADASAGEDVLYYDVDPVGDDRVLFVEEVKGQRATVLVVNWRTDEVVERFPVPSDTHDVDALGDDRYVVADKFHHRAYVYDAGSGAVVWEYNFSNHFPEYPAAGAAPSTQPSRAGGYTHLNDVDVVDNGSAFLLSPRNFNRVVLVDRETKETEWTLGAQNDTTTLNRQHNPTIVSRDPLTVLVADSANGRAVEYRRTDDGTWERTWEYRGQLVWPRDADRLPNGNTLIVASAEQRVLEVTPDREVVWERRVTSMPYDAELLEHGDEPAGPPIEGVAETTDTSEVSPLREVYLFSLWVLPPWVGFLEFYGLVAATLLALGWGGVELAVRIRRR